ncbi:hypothetical protein ASPFODRAFT_38028 [Aspergillus luchuensis CBS 106.47]|uniref:CENP-V/GFA domain-containing protein n=1 Tax=Aspergillus luchuensis (strain CBS 106.47) TaxID=1137211 RepID=A0A1M3T1J3_ASPLC|nr:hypothetical protein ASPFODRAFT_38028 [Aspergillus luchuensis CBS 106.47]
MTTTTGSCLCNACTYSYTGEPTLKAICHCTSCHKISGSSNTLNYTVPETAFSVTKGSPKSFSTTHESGMTLTVFFCPNCGSTLWKEATAENFKGLKVVQAGTLADASKLNQGVDVEFYTSTRAPWLMPQKDVAQRTEF